MSIFLTYDIAADRSLSVEGSLEEAVDLLPRGVGVYRRLKSWTTARWPGVAVPVFVPDGDLDPELAAFLHAYERQNASRPFSPQARRTFERECRRVFGTAIDVDRLPATIGRWAPVDATRGYATLDGRDRVPLANWQLQRPSVGPDGTLVPGADPAAVVYNESDPGAFWLARWTHRSKHYFTTLTEPYFEDVTQALMDIGADRPSASIAIDEAGDVREIRRSEETESESESESETDDEDGVGEEEGFAVAEDEEPVADGLEFELYTEIEQTMLPLGYMIPRAQEWQCVMAAIMSGFVQVKNLLKVRDFTLRNFHTLLGSFDIDAKYAEGARRTLDYIRDRLAADLPETMSKLTI